MAKLRHWLGGAVLGFVGGVAAFAFLYSRTSGKVLNDYQTRLAPAEFLMRLETAAAIRNGNSDKALRQLELGISASVYSMAATPPSDRTPEQEKALRAAKLYREKFPAAADDGMAKSAADGLAAVTVPPDFLESGCPAELRTLLE